MFPFVRNGNLDVVIVAGPHITCWPSVGVRTLSSICSASGLSVGIYGGPELMVKGVLPLHQTGGILFIEDTQKRIHRLHARSVIKIADKIQFPLPFECWHSEGLMLLSTIEALNKTVLLNWTPRVVILGTSNSALSFGSFLLNSKSTTEVICLEIFLQWGAKRYEGWETEKRRFEILGGKIVEGKPLSLTKKTAQTWEFVIQIGADAKNFEVSRVVSAGSFYKNNGIKEYPPGSLLFELEQTAPHTPENNMEGWTLEEKRATMLGLRVSKALSTEAGSQKKENQYLFKKTKIQLKNIFDHHDKPWSPTYHGKWLSKGDMKLLKSFSGVPQKAHCFRPIATIECFEHIPCNLCEKACPEGAIKLTKDRDSVLTESKCTGCGICLTICPSQSIALVHEKENNSISEITLPTQGSFDFKSGNSITLLNRRGESLESGKVLSHQLTLPLIRIGVPTHLLWETRGYKKNAAEQENELLEPKAIIQKTTVVLNGEKRLMQNEIPVSAALFEINQHRVADNLLCQDASCGLCVLTIDGTKKMACQTKVRPQMQIKFPDVPQTNLSQSLSKSSSKSFGKPSDIVLCPCTGLTVNEVLERIQNSKVKSPEALFSALKISGGRCHGLICREPLKQIFMEKHMDVSEWIDWHFPWSDWKLNAGD